MLLFLLLLLIQFVPIYQVKSGASKCRGHASTESVQTHFSKLLSDLDTTRTLNYASKKRERSSSPAGSEHRRAKTPRKSAPISDKRVEASNYFQPFRFLNLIFSFRMMVSPFLCEEAATGNGTLAIFPNIHKQGPSHCLFRISPKLLHFSPTCSYKCADHRATKITQSCSLLG